MDFKSFKKAKVRFYTADSRICCVKFVFRILILELFQWQGISLPR
ncbi:Hypothetical protein BN2458_PEG1134 [Helicobacter typhlonius]|uniref:Uncharacterized protein n=1 Tax=Helicobacter typhlonius TaxID=76936 RepID=A0A0S4PUP2_9HELI|nr:Hypothetical protein BN2458_PEG1134 [Helicobacter typhlonius]